MDLTQTQRYLDILDPAAEFFNGFTFQTFDDRKGGIPPRIIHGTFADVSAQLESLNLQGCGIFVTINETDGRGRRRENIQRIRAVWIDDDTGANIKTPIEPQIVVETSPSKFQRLYVVHGLTPEQHLQVQETLIAKYGSDKNAKDLTRVLRLPGFLHHKGEPFLSRIIHESGVDPYTVEELLAAFPPVAKSTASTKPQATPDYSPINDSDSILPDIDASNAAKYLPPPGEQSYEEWRNVGMALHHQFHGGMEGLVIFDEWSQNVREYQGFDDVQRAWEHFGNRVDGKLVTFRSLVKEYNKRQAKTQTSNSVGAAVHGLRLIEECDDYNTLICEIAPELHRLAHNNIVLEKDFLRGLMSRYAELRPGDTLSRADAQKAMRRRRQSENLKPDIAQNNSRAPEWAKNWIWVSEEEVFYAIDVRTRLATSGFDAHYNSFLPSGDGAPASASKFLRDANLVPKVMRSMFAPSMPMVFDYGNVSHVNTYNPALRAKIPPAPKNMAAVSVFKKHLELIFGGWNREAQIMANYLNYCTSEQPTKIRWAPLLVGAPGDGKSLLATLINNALGIAYTKTITGQTLIASSSSGQTGWGEGALFCAVEEVKFHGHNRFDVLNMLKPYITNDFVPVKKLYQESATVPNTQNYILFSNYKDGAPVEEGDRRYFIIISRVDLNSLPPDYFDKLHVVIHKHYQDVISWLREVPIHPDFDPNRPAPMTSDKQNVLRLVGDENMAIVAEMLEDSCDVHYDRSAICFAPLFNAFMARSNGAVKAAEEFKLGTILTKLGYTKLDRHRVFGTRQRLWAKNPKGVTVEWAVEHLTERKEMLDRNGYTIEELL